MIGPSAATVGAWSWHPHLLLWAVLAGVSAAAAVGHRRLLRTSSHPQPWPRSRILRFGGAVVLAGVSMGWPLGDLAAHWSLSALVLQRCLLVLAVAPLLLAGLSDDLIRWLTRPAPVDAVLIRVLRPPVAVVTVTVVLVVSVLPVLVAAQSSSVAARGGLALLVLAAGLVLWLPVMGRVPGIPRPRPMIRAVYLVAQSVVPVFLSFLYILATQPLYPAFARSVDVVRLRPLNDQQIAGFISKLSFVLVLLAVAGVVLSRAPDTDDDLGPEDPLSWSDVERHFERVDRRGQAMPEPGPVGPTDRDDWDGRAAGSPGEGDADVDGGPVGA
ncbi:MAG TPA: cytochrome c oxidase assembly protein [Acidimicrobiales bacterium]